MIYILLSILLLINIIFAISLIRYHLAVRDLSRQIEENWGKLLFKDHFAST